MELVFTDGRDARFQMLCQALDDYLDGVLGGEKQRSQYRQYNTLDRIHDVALILENGEAIACGGYKAFEPGVAEIKRVFALPEHRGLGYGKAIMVALEGRAVRQGYHALVLETGRLLRSARALYQALGYREIANYGQYAEMKDSVCYQKDLCPPSGGAIETA